MTSTTQAKTVSIQGAQVTISDVERRVARGYLEGDRDGTYARVTFADGRMWECSQLDDEDGWTVDASWGKGSFPHWCNGYGARYLITRRVAHELLTLALDVAARDAN